MGSTAAKPFAVYAFPVSGYRLPVLGYRFSTGNGKRETQGGSKLPHSMAPFGRIVSRKGFKAWSVGVDKA
jgi:hypothetical protein